MATLGSAPTPVDASLPIASPAAVATTPAPRHSLLVRVTHWLFTLCFFALLVTGIEILISHPRFYWGETGNINMSPLFKIPIPSSRNLVPTGYGYVLPDQNGWSRYLHFQAAWLVVFTGLLYALHGFFSGHFRKRLLPGPEHLSRKNLSAAILSHLRFEPPAEAEAHSYNVLQRLAYAFAIFAMFPMMIWTGLAMSPAFTSAFPVTVTILGGHQSARTLHFLLTIAFVLFLFVHLLMIFLAGFFHRTRAMITGRVNNRADS
jgi:thiosulfate reductase cytochrome b subunit